MSVQERIREDVARHGWHAVMVRAGDPGEPPFAYTIGFSRTFEAPEIILSGLEAQASRILLAELAGRVRGGLRLEPGRRVAGVIANEDLLIDAVDPLWLPEYVGQALQFYDPEPVTVLQAMWPDRSGAFPSDPGFAPALRVRQPWLASTWHFDVPRGEVVAVDVAVIAGAPILEVAHTREGWRFGRAGAAALVSLESMVERDPTIAYVASLPVGWSARRASQDEPWERTGR